MAQPLDLMAVPKVIPKFKRFRDWVKTGIWQKRFGAVSGQPDMQYAMVDATIVKVHRHGQGAGLKARP